MELPYDCPLHVCKANGFMAEKGEPTKLLIPAMDQNNQLILSSSNSNARYNQLNDTFLDQHSRTF